jgi:hypothetical protein
MAKATLRLNSGTNVTLEGTPEEIQKILTYFEGPEKSDDVPKRRGSQKARRESADSGAEDNEPDISVVVNLAKTCNESEAIEKHILDRTSVVDRTLLPLYIVHKYQKNAYGLTSGDINRFTTELGIPIATPNIANTLAGSASRYVVGDKLRKRGTAVRYKLSHRGLKYLQSIIAGDDNAKQG